MLRLSVIVFLAVPSSLQAFVQAFHHNHNNIAFRSTRSTPRIIVNSSNKNKNNNKHHGGLPISPPDHHHCFTTTLYANNGENEEEDEQVLNRVDFVRQVLGVKNTGLDDIVKVGDVIIAKQEVLELGIERDEGYQIISMYDQGFNEELNIVEKIPLSTIDTSKDSTMRSNKQGYTRYIQLSISKNGPFDNDNVGVIVTPDEIGLTTLKSEVFNAMLLAIPGFIWVFVALSFANNYNDRYGGNFFDALFRT